VRAGDNATNTLNAQDAAARQANQRFYIGQNGILGQQKLAQQQYNKFDKYTEQFNKAAALRGAANQNIQNGINAISSTATGLYGLGDGNDTDAVTKASILGPRVGAQSLIAPLQTSQSLFSTPSINNPTGLGIYSRYANAAPNYLDRFSYGQNIY